MQLPPVCWVAPSVSGGGKVTLATNLSGLCFKAFGSFMWSFEAVVLVRASVTSLFSGCSGKQRHCMVVQRTLSWFQKIFIHLFGCWFFRACNFKTNAMMEYTSRYNLEVLYLSVSILCTFFILSTVLAQLEVPFKSLTASSPLHFRRTYCHSTLTLLLCNTFSLWLPLRSKFDIQNIRCS